MNPANKQPQKRHCEKKRTPRLAQRGWVSKEVRQTRVKISCGWGDTDLDRTGKRNNKNKPQGVGKNELVGYTNLKGPF